MGCNTAWAQGSRGRIHLVFAAGGLPFEAAAFVPLRAQINPGRPPVPQKRVAQAPLPFAGLTDPQIMQIALSENSGDSARGKFSEQKSANPDVKAFGRVMAVEYGALNRQAAALVTKLKLTPQASRADSVALARVQGMTSELQTKSGRDFDQTYMDQEVQIHQLLLSDLDKTLIPGAQNPELKAFLQTSRGMLDAHLQRAQMIQSKLK